MRKYFLEFRCNSGANKAQEELQNYGREWNQTLCDETGLERVIITLVEKCDWLNEKHKRCRKMKVHAVKYNGICLDAIIAETVEDYQNIFTISVTDVLREEFADYQFMYNEKEV